MKKIEPLYIPPEKRDFGLKVDCSLCGTLVTDTCRNSGKPLIQCEHGDRHSFKVIAYKKEKRRTKNLITRELKQARLEAAQFQQDVKKETENSKAKHYSDNEEKKQNGLLLTEALALHVGFLRGENTPEHKRKVRGNQHCKQVEGAYLDFILCLKKYYAVKDVKVDQVSQAMVGKYFAYLNSRKFSPRSFNMHIGFMRTMYNFLIREGYTIANPFLGVVRKPETHSINTFTKEEYEAILNIIQKPELGICELKTGERKNYYKPFMMPAVCMGAMSGRRVEEIISMKWKDIVPNGEDKMFCINVIDYKVSRQQNRLNDNPKIISVPITNELKELFIELGYEKFKGSDQYILAPEEKMNRDSIRKFISHSFSHYWKQLPFSKEKKASYKTLRKTYLSSLSAAIGISNAQVISQHSDTKVLSNHYVSQHVLGITAKNFSVFPKENTERQKELNQLRKSEKSFSIER